MAKSDYMDEHPSGGGRPFLTINDRGKKLIETLAGYMCTDEEIANALDVTVDTLKNQRNKETFSECKQKGLAKGKVSLRRMQFRLAERNATMAIWLGRNILGQTDGESPFERDSEAIAKRASVMQEFAKLASPAKDEIEKIFADEGKQNENSN